jgi:hypothetical protein
MGDYTETHSPGAHVTYTASGAITGGQVVALVSAGTVATAAGTALEPIVGVACHDQVAGQKVTVARGGVQRPIAAGVIAAGAYVKSAAAGQVTTFVTGTDNPVSCLGVAIEAGTASNPMKIEWRA